MLAGAVARHLKEFTNSDPAPKRLVSERHSPGSVSGVPVGISVTMAQFSRAHQGSAHWAKTSMVVSVRHLTLQYEFELGLSKHLNVGTKTSFGCPSHAAVANSFIRTNLKPSTASAPSTTSAASLVSSGRSLALGLIIDE
eukprot:Amastigsp_a844498_22.p3 type:complete len:140 gc:universal Amastigsp_a844498_22:445-26(-)